MLVLQQLEMGSQRKEELFSIIVILLLMISPVLSQSDCSPAFTLPNILKDQISLQYNNGAQQTYSYLFFSGMFSGQPVIAYSLSQANIQQTNVTLNYYLDVQIQDMFIYFYFNSPNFKWTLVSVNFWITSRNDLIIAKNVMKNLNQGQNNTISFALNNSIASINPQSTHVVFLVGVYSNFSKNLTISLYPGVLTSTTGSLSVFVGANIAVANISILSVIYNPYLGQYLSSSGTLNYKSFSNQYYNLFNNFVPIYYVMIGLNSITLTGQNLNNFQYSLVINSTILQASSNNVFDFLGISFVTIGVVTSAVCSPCNNFIYSGNCVDACPASTFAYTFSDSGKACLSCDSRVGQIINSLSNGCNCLPGYEIVSSNQCANSINVSTNCTGVNVIQNGTSCICSPGTYNISGVCGVCPAGQSFQSGVCIANTSCPLNATFNTSQERCVCISGYMNISNSCIPCQQGQYYDFSSSNCKCIAMNQEINSVGACVCSAGFHNINGFCISCPDGTVYDGNSCVTQVCPNNQVMINGTCACDSSSIPVGSICVKCGNGAFPNKVTNLCDACIDNCLVCLNKVTCSQCINGFIFDFSQLRCYNPNTPTTLKLVSLKSGFPVYTIQGIITDFMINSTGMNTKSKSDLIKMVSIQFADLATIPIRTYYSQNSAQLNNIRVAFYYEGLIPLNSFNVTYIFNDASINLQQNTTINYQYTASRLQYRIN